MSRVDELLQELKQNLRIEHDVDDPLLTRLLLEGIDYAEQFQHKPAGTYKDPATMLGATRRAVIIFASASYESPDAGQSGYFGGNSEGAKNTWEAIDNQLRLDREWKV